GLRVAAFGTGHQAPALPALDGTLLLRTELHAGAGVTVDPARHVARVPAGALWADVVEAAAAHGLAALHGSSPDVGVIGYLLGGGLSFYARRHGLAADHVRAIELVSADGEARRVDAGHEPELFWALRGGGGGFGVVTAAEIDLFPIATVYAGMAVWPVEAAADVLRAWLGWAPGAPPEITTSLRILRLPPVPDVPEPMRGVPVVALDGVALADAAGGEALLAPLRAAAAPMLDGWAEMPAAAAVRVHGDPEQPVPGLGASALLGELDAAAADAFVVAAGADSGSTLLAAELRQLGGALARAPAGAGATGSLSAPYLLFGVGALMAPDAEPGVRASLERLVSAMAPWDTGRRLLGFDDAGGPAERCHDPDALARLAHVRRAWDPQRRFVATHEVALS
ncbi:MAG: FAD-binding oxidoreductase, partial [Solirubrobacteraceae bacterium]|nr:FAD-binding oxidoreductase [Solirubrobacteraceae bacterium]